MGSSAPCDSPPGVPLSRQWWVQLTVAGTMSGDSSAAGYHFGFWCFGKVGTAAKILSLISLKCESSVLSYLLDADSSCCFVSSVLPACFQELHVALAAVLSSHCSPPSLQTSVPLWPNAYLAKYMYLRPKQTLAMSEIHKS